MSRPRGLSLIELLVTLTLGTIVLGGVLRVFASSQEAWRVQDDTARVQENLRFAMSQMTRAVRQAAFLGGARVLDVHSAIAISSTDAPCSLAWAANPANAVRGFEGATRSPVPVCTVGRYVAQSDILVTTYSDPDGLPQPEQFMVSHPDFASGNLFLRVLVGGNAFLFDGAGNRPAAVNAVPGSAADGVQEYRMRTMAYSLGTFDDPSDRLPPVPALYVCDSTTRCGVRTNPQPLIEGIEQLQADYGIDQDHDRVAERFLPAREITPETWPSVVAIRIGLVARGERLEPLGEARDYALPGGYRHRPVDDPRTTIDERRLVRRALVQSVQIRNRVRG